MNSGRPRLLVTLPDLAWPTHSGKRRRLASVVRGLAAVGRLDALVLFADTGPGATPLPPDIPVENWAYLPPDSQPVARTVARSLTRALPWQIAVRPWERASAAVSEWEPPYDLVWFGSLDHAISFGSQRWAPRVLVDCDDVETAKLRRYLAAPRPGRWPDRDRLQRRVELPMWATVQRRVLRAADRVFVCSQVDRARLAESGPLAKIRVLPNTYPDVAMVTRAPAGGCTVVMIADYANEANADAARIAAQQVLPLLRSRQPDAVVRLVGRKAERLSGVADVAGVQLIGEVSEDRIPDELSRAHAVLVPLRFAGGTRLKIIEAFAHGVPVVSTAAGAEGLDIIDGEHALIANDAAGLAAAVLRMASDQQLAERMRNAGRLLYETRYRPVAAQTVVADSARDLLAR